jgi:hypothetical protein
MLINLYHIICLFVKENLLTITYESCMNGGKNRDLNRIMPVLSRTNVKPAVFSARSD